MSDSNELNETNHTCTITNIFNKLFLASELRSHEEVSKKNCEATEDKIHSLYRDLDEHAKDKSVANLLEYRKHKQELRELNAQFSKQERALREASEKEKELQEELSSLKSRLDELEKQKATFDKANKNVLQENKIELVAFDKAIKVYSSRFSMSLEVVAAEGDKISCKVSFKRTPECFAIIELDKDKEQVTAFHLHGISAEDETVLRSKFNEHKDATQLLVDLRNVILTN